MAKTYRALQTGYDGLQIIAEGTVFTTDKPKGKWMQELDENGKPVEDKPKRGRPPRAVD